MITEYQREPAGSVVNSIARFCILAATLIILLTLAYFIVGIVNDGIDAKLIALDSYDLERTKVWRTRYTNEALRGWAIPGLLALGVTFVLIGGMVRSAREAWRRLR